MTVFSKSTALHLLLDILRRLHHVDDHSGTFIRDAPHWFSKPPSFSDWNYQLSVTKLGSTDHRSFLSPWRVPALVNLQLYLHMKKNVQLKVQLNLHLKIKVHLKIQVHMNLQMNLFFTWRFTWRFRNSFRSGFTRAGTQNVWPPRACFQSVVILIENVVSSVVGQRPTIKTACANR